MAKSPIIQDAHHIIIQLTPQDQPPATLFHLTSKDDPDIPIEITAIDYKSHDQAVLTTSVAIDPKGSYSLHRSDTGAQWQMAPSLIGTFLTVILASALIQNFVFTRYLGLCVFFGVSRKQETAIGMGVTFTMVGILSGLFAWLMNRFVLGPLQLNFLQIIVFIGTVAFLVQMTDTIMKKLHRSLHKKFGIYVVLITTNCIILAVPLLNAMNNSGFWESLALAIGSGLGFALALFLMSCAREKADLSPIPVIFKGLPIAFILAGLFALAFMGFSGLKV